MPCELIKEPKPCMYSIYHYVCVYTVLTEQGETGACTAKLPGGSGGWVAGVMPSSHWELLWFSPFPPTTSLRLNPLGDGGYRGVELSSVWTKQPDFVCPRVAGFVIPHADVNLTCCQDNILVHANEQLMGLEAIRQHFLVSHFETAFLPTSHSIFILKARPGYFCVLWVSIPLIFAKEFVCFMFSVFYWDCYLKFTFTLNQ